jgi:hypothetical protein
MSPAVTAFPKASRLLPAGALALSALLLLPVSAVGQDAQAEAPPSAMQAPGAQPQVEGETRAPAYIAAVDGAAHLDRDGQSETAERGVPLVPGDRLRTDGGRVEMAFPNGSQVYLDRYTEVELQDPLSLRVARGRLYVRVSSTIDAAERLAIDGPNASVEFQDDGEYRVAIGGTDAAEVELVVLRGQAALSSEGGNVLVPQGHSAVAERPVRLAAVPPRRARGIRLDLRSLRHLAERRDLRRGLVSDQHRRRLAAVLRRPLGLHLELRVDMDRRRRRLGLPHPPLRPLEPRLARLVLDSLPALGRGMGLLGGGVGLRRLVPARLERSAGPQRVPLRPRLHVPLARSLPRLDGDPAHVLRPGAGVARVRGSQPARS